MAQRIRPVNQHLPQDHLISAQSSIEQVQTLVSAGIGCIAFLRGLFDEDSFEDAKLEAPRPVDTTTVVRSAKDRERLERPSTVRIKKLKKGGCDSADKLIDWLDLGVSDAIEKGFLHRLVFAIYLDPEDPTNLVESYTFTFTYEIDDQGTRRAEMEVHDQMKGMLLSSTSRIKEDIHKEGEVKRQVQQVIKNLLTSTQLLDELPRRRFFTLRALWYDETPDDYQPYGFKRLTRSWSDYSFTTPSIHAPPEGSSLGAVKTGYHGVSIHTVTISHILDTSFDDTITKEEATGRNQREAASRSVVWDAQTLVESVIDCDYAMKSPQPLGVTNEQGQMVDIETVTKQPDFSDLRKKVGIEVDANKGVWAKGLVQDGPLTDSNLSDNENLRRAIAANTKAQVLAEESPTQENPVKNRRHSHESLQANLSISAVKDPLSLGSHYAAHASDEAISATTQVRFEGGSSERIRLTQEKAKATAEAEAFSSPAGPSLNETQLLDFSNGERSGTYDTIMRDISDVCDGVQEPDTITSQTQIVAQTTPIEENVANPADESSKNASRKSEEDETCECGDPTESGVMVCCSSCESWRHNVCYGYPESEDDFPEVFTCYRCRAHAVTSDTLLDDSREGEAENALANFKSLALFRRAISLVWLVGVVDSKHLSETLNVDKTTAAQVLKRLKMEEFIISTRPEASRRGSRGCKSVSKRDQLIVNKSIKQAKYKKSVYFTPGRGAEQPILALLCVSTGDPAVSHEPVRRVGPFESCSEQEHIAGSLLYFPNSSGSACIAKAHPERETQMHSVSAPELTSRVLVQDTPSPVASAEKSTSYSRQFGRDKTLDTLEEEREEDLYDSSSALSELTDLSDIEGSDRDSARLPLESMILNESSSTFKEGLRAAVASSSSITTPNAANFSKASSPSRSSSPLQPHQEESSGGTAYGNRSGARFWNKSPSSKLDIFGCWRLD